MPGMQADDMVLIYYPDKILFQEGQEISDFGESLQANIECMSQIMDDHRGIGLAAHQVGWPVKLFIVAIPRPTEEDDSADPEQEVEPIIDRFTFINPTFTYKSKKQVIFEEGCLSFPGILGKIKRPESIHITAFDATGKKFSIEAEGLMARCIQHEYDHITGQLFHRLWSQANKTALQGKLKELQLKHENKS